MSAGVRDPRRDEWGFGAQCAQDGCYEIGREPDGKCNRHHRVAPALPAGLPNVETLAAALQEGAFVMPRKRIEDYNPDDFYREYARSILAALEGSATLPTCPGCGRTDEHAAPCVNRMRLAGSATLPSDRIDRLRLAYHDHVREESGPREQETARKLVEAILAVIGATLPSDRPPVSPDHPDHPWKQAAREGKWDEAERLLKAATLPSDRGRTE